MEAKVALFTPLVATEATEMKQKLIKIAAVTEISDTAKEAAQYRIAQNVQVESFSRRSSSEIGSKASENGSKSSYQIVESGPLIANPSRDSDNDIQGDKVLTGLTPDN